MLVCWLGGLPGDRHAYQKLDGGRPGKEVMGEWTLPIFESQIIDSLEGYINLDDFFHKFLPLLSGASAKQQLFFPDTLHHYLV